LVDKTSLVLAGFGHTQKQHNKRRQNCSPHNWKEEKTRVITPSFLLNLAPLWLLSVACCWTWQYVRDKKNGTVVMNES
jgi:hypothetical protein